MQVPRAGDMAGVSILIVEDHTMIAEYVASILADAGYEAIQAHTLAAARSALSLRDFDLLLCDRYLPDGESQALLEAIGTDSRHATIPAIVLSADMNADSRLTLLASGFVDVLAKPCQAPRLLDAIRTALTGHGSALPVEPADRTADAEPVLDDAAALLICAGNTDTLASLRRLFAAELPSLRERLACFANGNNAAGLSQELHRLSAAAAWCGAMEVKAYCQRLRQGPAPALHELDQALLRLQQALAH